MLYESPNISIRTCDGVATVELHFPGTPVNAWNVLRLAEFSHALELIEREPSLEITVIRSGLPGGFCGGFDPESLEGIEALAFARQGQRVCEQLRKAPFVSVAFLEGPCLGPGWDISLACDDRLAVAGPNSAIGFGPAPTGWGGFTRLKARVGATKARRFFGASLTPREAMKLGAIDHTCSGRRAKIELQTWLDRRRMSLNKRTAGWRSWFMPTPACLTTERQQFADAVSYGYPEIAHEDFEPLPKAIKIAGNKKLAIEYAIRGVRVTFLGNFTIAEADFTDRGRLTPLEASQAMKLITVLPEVERNATAPARQLQYAA